MSTRRPTSANRPAAGAADKTVHPAQKTGSLRVTPDRGATPVAELVIVSPAALQGRLEDANGPRIARALLALGTTVRRIQIVDGSAASVAATVRAALEGQAHLVVTAGGLGPAESDVTLNGVADAIGLPLEPNAVARDLVEGSYGRLAKRRIVAAGMTAARDKLCRMPVGAEPLANARGVAHGALIRLTGGAAVLCLPGLPAELDAVLEVAQPLLDELLPRRQRATREIETPTADESTLGPLLAQLRAEHPEVRATTLAGGYRDRGARVRVLLETAGSDRNECESRIETAMRRLLALAAGVR